MAKQGLLNSRYVGSSPTWGTNFKETEMKIKHLMIAMGLGTVLGAAGILMDVQPLILAGQSVLILAIFGMMFWPVKRK